MTNVDRIVAILKESDRPLTTSEIARAAQLWDHEASGALTHLKRVRRVKVVDRVKAEKGRNIMYLWASAEGDKT